MRKKIRGSFILALLGVIGVLSLVGCNDKKNNNNANKEITISIAASLQGPMEKIQELFKEKTGIDVKLNSGGSGTLKKQIESGANVDMFFSANKGYSEELLKEGYIYNDKIYSFLGNSLVLIKGEKEAKINNLKQLETVKGKIAIGEVNTVPAGQYAKKALENLGIYNNLKDKLVYGKNVVAVKNYVESGNSPYGFVYKTDAYNLKNSEITYELNESSYGKIEYTLSILKASKDKEADEKFLEFLKSSEAEKIFKEYGFKIN